MKINAAATTLVASYCAAAKPFSADMAHSSAALNIKSRDGGIFGTRVSKRWGQQGLHSSRVERAVQRAAARSRDSPARVSSDAVAHLRHYGKAVQTLGMATVSGHFVKLCGCSQVFRHSLAELQEICQSNGAVGVVGGSALLREQQGDGSISSRHACALQVRA
jgi:hypothetical protein